MVCNGPTVFIKSCGAETPDLGPGEEAPPLPSVLDWLCTAGPAGIHACGAEPSPQGSNDRVRPAAAFANPGSARPRNPPASAVGRVKQCGLAAGAPSYRAGRLPHSSGRQQITQRRVLISLAGVQMTERRQKGVALPRYLSADVGESCGGGLVSDFRCLAGEVSVHSVSVI